jgi:hypothetical protein
MIAIGCLDAAGKLPPGDSRCGRFFRPDAVTARLGGGREGLQRLGDFSVLAMKASVSRKTGTSDRMMGAIAATMR